MGRALSLLAVAMFAVVAGTHSASAAPPERIFTVTIDLFGKGSVKSAPSGITCPGDCTEAYGKKTSVTLTAAPDYNNAFVGWAGACSGTQTICTLSVTSSVDVMAVFEQKYPAPIARTGQTTPQGSGDDAVIQAGASPTPRFIDNADGTATDMLTGLTWMKDMAAFGGLHVSDGIDYGLDWSAALAACNSLSLGSHEDWRLANFGELLSLVDFEQGHPLLPVGHPFINVPLYQDGRWPWFWSSTSSPVYDTYLGTRNDHYGVDIDSGDIRYQPPGGANQALCVRGP